MATMTKSHFFLILFQILNFNIFNIFSPSRIIFSPLGRVPIVKFSCVHTDLTGDIAVGNMLAIRNTELLKTYTEIDNRVRELGRVKPPNTATLEPLINATPESVTVMRNKQYMESNPFLRLGNKFRLQHLSSPSNFLTPQAT